MDSANREDREFANSNRATVVAELGKQFRRLNYIRQLSDEGKEIIRDDPYMDVGNINESSSEDEINFMDSSSGLIEDDSELKYHHDMEGILGNVNASHCFKESDTLLMDTKYNSEDLPLNPPLQAAGNEIPSSSSDAPQMQNPPVEISGEIEPSDLNLNPSSESMDSSDNQNEFQDNSENLGCHKDRDSDGKYLPNDLNKTHSRSGSIDCDHNYAAKCIENVLPNADNSSGPRAEEMTTECENRIDPKDVDDQSSEKPFVCATCGSRFRLESTLRGHLQVHPKKKSNRCKHCQAEFPSYKILVEHLNTHTKERTFVCPICGRAFECKISLTNHELVHTGERPHVCRVCGRGFGLKQPLEVHMRSHTGESPFVCEACGKAFKQRTALHSHKKHNHEKIIYKCEECGKKYKRKDYFEKHYRMHDDKPSKH